jgi:hypothetical protein
LDVETVCRLSSRNGILSIIVEKNEGCSIKAPVSLFFTGNHYDVLVPLDSLLPDNKSFNSLEKYSSKAKILNREFEIIGGPFEESNKKKYINLKVVLDDIYGLPSKKYGNIKNPESYRYSGINTQIKDSDLPEKYKKYLRHLYLGEPLSNESGNRQSSLASSSSASSSSKASGNKSLLSRASSYLSSFLPYSKSKNLSSSSASGNSSKASSSTNPQKNKNELLLPLYEFPEKGKMLTLKFSNKNYNNDNTKLCNILERYAGPKKIYILISYEDYSFCFDNFSVRQNFNRKDFYDIFKEMGGSLNINNYGILKLNQKNVFCVDYFLIRKVKLHLLYLVAIMFAKNVLLIGRLRAFQLSAIMIIAQSMDFMNYKLI